MTSLSRGNCASKGRHGASATATQESSQHSPSTGRDVREHSECWFMRAQGGAFELKRHDCPPQGGGRRGKVRGFSQASRRRLLRKCAALDVGAERNRIPAVFLTLTYPEQYPSCEMARSQLRRFLERVRRAYPKAAGFWRLELQDRGAPHFHLILFNLPFLSKDRLAAISMQCIRECLTGHRLHALRAYEVAGVQIPEAQRVFTRIEAIWDRRKALRYVSKYVAKVDKRESSGGFNNDAYLHEVGTTGRVWGVFNKDCMPWAELVEVVAELGRWVNTFRRCARQKWRGVARGVPFGFFLFCDDAYQWMRLAAEFVVAGREAGHEPCAT